MPRKKPTSKSFQKVILSQNTYIAEGLIDDCENLVQKCLQHSKLNFEKFCDLWKEMNFACVFYATTSGAELAELSEEAIHIAKYYLVTLNNTNNIEESVAGLFMVYAFLSLQPYPRFAALRLVPDDMPAIERLEMLARKERRHDILYILGEVLIRGPCQFHVSARERAIDKPISKYFDGTTQTNAGALRPVGVFNRHNEEVNLIKELGQLEKRYNESKKRITDPSSKQSLNYTEYTAVELEMTLRSIVAGILVEPKTDNDKKIEAEIRKNIQPEDNRNDAVKLIKDRAMKSTVDSMKHLTGLEERKPASPQKSSPDPPTPKGKGKGKGRASTKTLNPLIDLPSPPPITPPTNPDSQKSLQRILDDDDFDINDINANKTSPAKTALSIPKEPYRKRGAQIEKSPTIPEKRKKTERSVIPTTKRAKQIEIEISPTPISSITNNTNITEEKKCVRKRPSKKSDTNKKTESPKVARNSPLDKRNSQKVDQNIPLNIPITPKSARKIPALIPITPTSAGKSKTPAGAKKRLTEAFESPTPAKKVATKKPKALSSAKKAPDISDIGSPTLDKSETRVSAKNNALKKSIPQTPSKGNRNSINDTNVSLIEIPARNRNLKKSLSPKKELKTKISLRGKRTKAKAKSVFESDSNSDCNVTVPLSSDDEHENIDDESRNEKSNVDIIPIDSQTDTNSQPEQVSNVNNDTLPVVVDLQIDTLPSVFTTENGQIEIEIIDQFEGKGSKSEDENGLKEKTPSETVSKVEISSVKTGVDKVVEELAQIVKIKDRKYQKKRQLRSTLRRLGVLSVADLGDEHDSC